MKRSPDIAKGRMTWQHWRRQAVPYVLLAPVVLFVFCFMLWPILNVFMMSLEEYKVTRPDARHFIGLANFIEIFTDDKLFWKTLGNTAVYVIFSTVIQTILGFWLAYLLVRKFKGRGILRALALVPWAISGVMAGVIWSLMLGETYGVINDLLRKVGLISANVSWFSSRRNAMGAVMLANVWRGIPFFTISYMSALSVISGDLYESARIDGASSLKILFGIEIPMIKDTIVLTTLLRAIWTFNAVDLIVTLTDGGPNRGTMTLALYIMNTFQNNYDYGYASALSVIATVMMMIVAFIYIRLSRMNEGGNI